MKRKKYLFFLILFFFFYLPIPAAAEKNSLAVSQDTYVDSAYPEINFGLKKEISTAFAASSKIIFLQFDLCETPPLQAGEEAYLQLWLEKADSNPQPIEIEILLPNHHWQEEKLTWNNKPSLYSSGLTALFEATPGAQKADITPLVRQWLEGSTGNSGLALYQGGEAFQRSFAAREKGDHPPQLIINRNSSPALSLTLPEPRKETLSSPMVKAATRTAEIKLQSVISASSKKQVKENSVGGSEKKLTAIVFWVLALLAFAAGRLFTP